MTGSAMMRIKYYLALIAVWIAVFAVFVCILIIAAKATNLGAMAKTIIAIIGCIVLVSIGSSVTEKIEKYMNSKDRE